MKSLKHLVDNCTIFRCDNSFKVSYSIGFENDKSQLDVSIVLNFDVFDLAYKEENHVLFQTNIYVPPKYFKQCEMMPKDFELMLNYFLD